MSRAIRRPSLRNAVIGIAAMIAIQAHAGSASAHSEAFVAARYAGFPVRLCIAADARTLAAARRGEAQVEISLRNRTPHDRYSAPFKLSLIQADRRREVHTFGMHPDHREDGRVQAQRFPVLLRDIALQTDALGRLCFELDHGREARTPRAVIEVGLRWRPTGAP